MHVHRVDLNLADGTYELVPTQGGDDQSSEHHQIHVEQDPNIGSEEPSGLGANQGKPRSMSYVLQLSTTLNVMIVHLRSGVDWNHSCIILVSHVTEY